MSRPSPGGRDLYRHFTAMTTRWADNDAYGHVNNTVYYQWFDSAVNAWLVGEGLLDIRDGDPIALVVETRCTYHAPLSFPGDVEIGLSVVEVGRSSVRYRIGIFVPGASQAAAEGEFVHVAVGRADQRPVGWPQPWRDAFARLSSSG